MTLEGHLAAASRGWRGPALAALIAFLAGLPGLFAIPPLDRDESRFAQATAQMLESHDFVVIRFQDEPRFKKPVGIHWLQAASVATLSEAEARDIWAYRIPSLLGAMLAAAALAWGATAFLGAPGGLLAGAILGATFLLSTEAFIAKTDAALCGMTTLAMAAFARLYAASRDAPPVGRWTRLLFWLGLSGAVLIKGPVGLMVVALAMIALSLWDRGAPWFRRMGWGWGLIVFAAIIGPWAWAVTVATDGGFWTEAFGADLAPKLVGGQETHGAPPGYHTLISPLILFPATLLLPAAVVAAWRCRRETAVRFAIAWVVPAWIVFEAMPTKLVHYTLPTFGGIALLMAFALQRPVGPVSRWLGAALLVFVGAALAAGCFYLLSAYGDPADLTAVATTAVLFLATGLAGGYVLVRRAPGGAIAVAGVLGILAHGMLAAAVAPRLDPLWLSRGIEQALADARLLPRQGAVAAPVAIAGYAEPSAVFALGTGTDLGDADEAADAIADGRPAVVEAREEQAFRQALAERQARAVEVGEVSGIDYSNGDDMQLKVYAAPEGRAPAAAAASEAR